MSLPRICLIYTGGTIGMIETPDGLRPPEDPSDFLRIAPEIKELVEIDFVPLLNKDSTNMNPSDWEEMANAVYERRNEEYNGFVIAHGTDTMHFSASALAFALGRNLNFPVVFTGAQATPKVLHGDARVNLIRACKVALEEELAEVVISFSDYVFRGCRAQKKDEKKFDAFESPAFPPLAYITETIDIQPTAKRRNPKGRNEIEFRPRFEKGILQVAMIPGLEPELLKPAIKSDNCQGVILQSFGAGNVPNEGRYSFIPIIKELKEMGKPIIITSQFPAGSTIDSPYAPGKEAAEAGAIPTGNMTYAAATAKFRWVLALVKEEIDGKEILSSNKIAQIRKLMAENIVGEVGGVEPLD